MKKLKQLLCLLLCLCTVMGMVTVPASAVTKVTKLNIMVEEPKLGEKPAAKEDVWYSNSEYFELSDMQWVGDMDANGGFKSDIAYGVIFTFKATKPDQKIFGGAIAPEDLTVNEKKLENTFHYFVQDSGKTMIVYHRFDYYIQDNGGKMPMDRIDSLALTLSAPMAGAAPATASQIKTGNSYVDVESVKWTGALDANGRFKAGTKYTLDVTLHLNSKGFMFNLLMLSSTVNGKTTDQEYYFNSDHSRYRLVYTFPATKDAATVTEQNNARVTVTAPKVGEWPDFAATVPADWNSYVSYCDWSGTFDEYGRFQTGKSYTLNVTVKIKATVADYKFKSGTTNTINEGNAIVKSISSDGRTMKMSYTFPKLEGTAVAKPTGTTVDKFQDGDFGYLTVTNGNALFYSTPDRNTEHANYVPAPCTVAVMEANVADVKTQSIKWNVVLYKGKLMYMRANDDGLTVTYGERIKCGNNPVGTYSDPWSSDTKQSEGMIKTMNPDDLVLENNVPRLELNSGRSTTPGEARKMFYLDTSATVFSTMKPEPYSFVTATATYRANPGYFFYEGITYESAPLHLLQKGCAAQINYVDKNTVTVTYTIWVKDLYNQDSYTHDMQQFSRDRQNVDPVTGATLSYGSVGGKQQQYVATAKYYNPMGQWYKSLNVPADLDKLYGDKFKLPLYDAPSDDAVEISRLSSHGGAATLYAVDVNDMFPGGMVGEWCMDNAGQFIPKAMLTDINMAEGNTVGLPGRRVNPEFNFAGGTGTKEDPYLIKTAEQLNAVRLCYSDKIYYKMIADIDLSGWGNWVPIGGTPAYGGWPSITGYAHYNTFCFGGSFDGNGHTVSGMTIKIDEDNPAMYKSDIEMYFGLFGATSGYTKITGVENDKLTYGHWGEIKNLTVKDFNIDVTYRGVTVPAIVYAGGLAGLSSSTHITNCKSVGGKINIQFQRPEGKEHAFNIHAAGLVGVSRDAQFKNCSSNSTVNVRSSTYEHTIYDMSEVHALVNKTIGNDDTTLTGSKGTGKVTLTNAAPTAATSRFKDVKTTDYFYKPVEWAVGQAITAGVGNNNFGPNNTCTRAQILMFLWRTVGSPKPKTANPFKDVKTGDYFYNAAIWAYNMGMVTGNEFKGDTPCTRSATMTYIWKAAGAPQTAASDKFKDVPKTADYAQAVAWALSKGITAGTSDTTFGSNDTCTRGQIATFLYRVFGTPLEKLMPMK